MGHSADPVRVDLDGSTDAVERFCVALAAALDGGPAVLPVGPGPPTAGPPTGGPRPDGPGPALLVATSGSTGAPRLVALSAGALRASATATADRLGGPAGWLLALPAEHVAGAQVLVRSLLAGHRPDVLDLRAGFRPDGFAAAAHRLAARCPRRVTSLVPTQLGRLLDDDGAGLDALRGFAAVLVGGAALPPATAARAAAAGVAVVRTYGMSETAGGCVYDGVPLDGVRVAVARDGRIRLGGPTLADGYLGDPAATAAAFGRGWFTTGDLGRWTADGRLEVLGRADDVLLSGGVNVAPAAVERVLLAQPGVRDVCVVGLPDPQWGQRVAAVVVWSGGVEVPDTVARRWRAAVRAELGTAAVPRVLRALPVVPQRGIGKPDRAAVVTLLTDLG